MDWFFCWVLEALSLYWFEYKQFKSFILNYLCFHNRVRKCVFVWTIVTACMVRIFVCVYYNKTLFLYVWENDLIRKICFGLKTAQTSWHIYSCNVLLQLNPKSYALSAHREGLMLKPPLALAATDALNNTCEFGRQEVWSYGVARRILNSRRENRLSVMYLLYTLSCLPFGDKLKRHAQSFFSVGHLLLFSQ